MDPEEVQRLVEELKLTKDAGEAVVTINESEIPCGGEAGGTRFDRFVVGRIFAARVANREALRVQLPRILQTRGPPDIEIVGDNLFVVVFTNDRYRKHALLDGPWHFFDNLMLFKEPRGMEKPTDVLFDTFTTWIQCHNLPLACMNPHMIRRIAEHVGKVEEIDVGEGGNCIGQYARARVSRKLEKPLQRCVSIMTENENERHIILIRYERLPAFCSACGRVGHEVRHCDDEGVDKTRKTFGVWLKAGRTAEVRRGRLDMGRREVGEGRSEKSDRSSFMEQRGSMGRGIVSRGRDLEGGNDEGKSENDFNRVRDLEVGEKEGTEGEGESLLSGDGERGDFMEGLEGSRAEKDNLMGGVAIGRQMITAQPTKPSPKKKKKGRGKEWKRMAREKIKSTTEETEGAVMRDGRGDNKRKGGQERDLDLLAPKSKVSKLFHGTQKSLELTVETASQSRRSQ